MFSALTLFRIKSHIKNGVFGIISAWKEGLEKIDNLEAMNDLIERIKSLATGYIPIIGLWEGEKIRAIFIYNITKDDLQDLAKEFGQEVFIHGNQGHCILYDTDGNAISDGHNFKVLELDGEVMNYREHKNKRLLLSDMKKAIRTIEYRLNNEHLSNIKRRHLEKTLEG
ncbi:unnamed protein product, partial [marine sediment metagenome]